MNATDLVAVWIQKIAQVHHAHRALSWAWRVFHASAAIGHSNIVKFLHLLWRVTDKANGGAIGDTHRLTINRFAYTESRAFEVIKVVKKQNKNKPLTINQKKKAIKIISETFPFASYVSTLKYLTRKKAKNLT